MRTMCTVIALGLSLAVAGCASKSPPPAAAAPATHVEKLDSTNVVEAQTAGYKLVNKNGEKLFCRTDKNTGSRVRTTTTCLTEAQMIEQQTANKQSMEHFQAVPQTRSGN